jgi:hypothetical protein
MSNQSPEHDSVESFVTYCIDDDIETFTLGDAQKIAASTGKTVTEIVAELKSFGLKILNGIKKTEPRGFNSNNNDLYTAKNGWVSGMPIGNASRQMISPFQPK